MPDAYSVLLQRLQAAFDTVMPGADPVLRASERADFQANGALALSKEMGRAPRDVAEEVVAAAVLDDVCATVEISGPGFINLDAGRRVRVRPVGRHGRRRPPGGAAHPPPADHGDRLLLAQRGQGDARRAPAHHGDRRLTGPGVGVPGAPGAAGEPHRGLGDAVRNADRAADRGGRVRRRRVVQRARPQRVLRPGPADLRPRSRLRRALPPAGGAPPEG